MHPRICQPEGCTLFYIVQKQLGQSITVLCTDGDWVSVKEITKDSIESTYSIGDAPAWGFGTIESARRIEISCQLIAKKSGNRNVFQRIGVTKPKRTEREEGIIRKMNDIVRDEMVPAREVRGG